MNAAFQAAKDDGNDSQDGQGLIELALVLPVFVLMIFGFISLAMVMYGISNVTYANRLLVRYACVHSSTSFHPIDTAAISTIITPYLNSFPSNTVTTSTSWSSGAPAVGTSITTTLTVTYHITLPGFTLSPLTIGTTAAGVVVQ